MKLVGHHKECHDTSKFTLEKSNENANFLDINISKDPLGNLQTNLYCKPTDSHNYLLYSSEHPGHVLKGIPYLQFLCLRRIFMLSSDFIRRGYPKNLVLNALERATKLDRDEILNKDFLKKSLEENTPTINTPNTPHNTDKPSGTTPNDTKRFYCITTHNPLNPPIRDIVSKN